MRDFLRDSAGYRPWFALCQAEWGCLGPEPGSPVFAERFELALEDFGLAFKALELTLAGVVLWMDGRLEAGLP